MDMHQRPYSDQNMVPETLNLAKWKVVICHEIPCVLLYARLGGLFTVEPYFLLSVEYL